MTSRQNTSAGSSDKVTMLCRCWRSAIAIGRNRSQSAAIDWLLIAEWQPFPLFLSLFLLDGCAIVMEGGDGKSWVRSELETCLTCRTDVLDFGIRGGGWARGTIGKRWRDFDAVAPALSGVPADQRPPEPEPPKLRLRTVPSPMRR